MPPTTILIISSTIVAIALLISLIWRTRLTRAISALIVFVAATLFAIAPLLIIGRLVTEPSRSEWSAPASYGDAWQAGRIAVADAVHERVPVVLVFIAGLAILAAIPERR
jgi:hypothetical protein